MQATKTLVNLNREARAPPPPPPPLHIFTRIHISTKFLTLLMISMLCCSNHNVKKNSTSPRLAQFYEHHPDFQRIHQSYTSPSNPFPLHLHLPLFPSASLPLHLTLSSSPFPPNTFLNNQNHRSYTCTSPAQTTIQNHCSHCSLLPFIYHLLTSWKSCYYSSSFRQLQWNKP